MSKRGKTSSGPPLSADDQALWEDYTRAVKRLKPARKDTEPGQPKSGAASICAPRPQDRSSLKRSTAMPASFAPSPAAQRAPAPVIEQRLVKRVQRGRHDIDATLDLHGLTQAEAKPRLIAFLRQAQARDFRMVLVITGKGRGGRDRDSPYASQPESGVLQRAVRLWLEEGESRALAVGFADAHQRHGGGGAVYVQLRRTR